MLFMRKGRGPAASASSLSERGVTGTFALPDAQTFCLYRAIAVTDCSVAAVRRKGVKSRLRRCGNFGAPGGFTNAGHDARRVAARRPVKEKQDDSGLAFDVGRDTRGSAAGSRPPGSPSPHGLADGRLLDVPAEFCNCD